MRGKFSLKTIYEVPEHNKQQKLNIKKNKNKKKCTQKGLCDFIHAGDLEGPHIPIYLTVFELRIYIFPI